MRPPAAPTTMRITPTVLMSTPDTSAETAHVRIAPIAISRRLTPIPIIHPFLLTGSGPSPPSRRDFEVARTEYPDPARGKRGKVCRADGGSVGVSERRHVGLRRRHRLAIPPPWESW